MVKVTDAKKINEATIALVDSKKEYSISELTDMQLFPWHKDRRSYRKSIMHDMSGPNILKVKITGEGKGRDYKLIGKNIIVYLKMIGEAMILAKGLHNGKQKINRPSKRSGKNSSRSNKK